MNEQNNRPVIQEIPQSMAAYESHLLRRQGHRVLQLVEPVQGPASVFTSQPVYGEPLTRIGILEITDAENPDGKIATVTRIGKI